MRKATVCYFKKRIKAWVAETAEGRVLLPVEAAKILEGDSLRDVGPAEPRPKPKQYDEVLFVRHQERPDYAAEWALA